MNMFLLLVAFIENLKKKKKFKNPNYQEHTYGLTQERKSSRSFTWILIRLPTSLDVESFTC